MNPTLVAGLVALAIVLTVVTMSWLHSHKAPTIVTRVEQQVVQDAWKLLGSSVASVADASGKKAALANAQSDLTEHFENVRKLKAAVAALPEA